MLGSMTAFVVADCRPQSGKPTNQTLCNGIIGGAGDQQITVDKDQTVIGAFFGDGVIGNGGNDTIINNGTTVSENGGTGRNGDIEGDVATGSGGDDVIVNNGTVAGDMDGDTALVNGGNDVIVNNGTVGDDMDGDNARKNGGSDLIINNGTVGGDIQADDNEDVDGSVGGNDTIVINGTVEGSVDGDAGVKTGGDDLVILQNGANGGADHTLYINGNDGDDTLAFNFFVSDQAAIDALKKEITAANPAKGSLTFNGQTFEWENFEHLNSNLMQAWPTSSQITTNGQPRALNITSYDRHVMFYCTTSGMTILGGDSQSSYMFNLKAKTVADAFQKATTTKTWVEIETVVTNGKKHTLYVRDVGDLDIISYDHFGRYDFSPAGTVCTK